MHANLRHRPSRHLLAAGLAACAMLTACAANYSPTPAMVVPATATGQQLDALFVQRALQGQMFAVAASQLAIEKNVNPATQQYASLILENLRANGGVPPQLAQQLNLIAAPSALPAEEQKLAELRRAEGPDFDRMFASYVGVALPTEMAALYDQAATMAADQAVKDFAQSRTEIMRSQLRAGQALYERMY